MSATLQAGGSDSGAAEPEPEQARPLLPRDSLIWRIALAVLLVGAAALMLYLARGLTFNLDEWTVVTDRRGPGAPSLLEPHNEHLTLLLLALYIGMLEIAGLDAYWFMMLPLVALQVTLGVLLFVIARRRVGAGVAVAVAGFALLCGLAYENFLVAGQAAQMFSIVAGVGAFAILDLPRTRRNDLLLAGLITVALASSGMGIPIVAGVGVELLLTRAGRERLWVVAAPFALYLVWYAAFGTSRADLEELGVSALWAWTAANHAAGAIIGERQIEPGRDLLIILLAVIAYRAFKVDGAARIRLAALATLLLTFYGLTAISRHDIAPPSSSRYLTVGLVFLLLMLVEAARGWRIRAWVPWIMLLVVWVAFGKADGNAQAFRDARALLLDRSEKLRASLGAADLLGRARMPADFEIAPLLAPYLTAGGFFEARDGLGGNPADSLAELQRASPGARAAADDTLIRAGGLRLAPPRQRPQRCERPWPSGDSGAVPPQGVRVEAGKERLRLRARRFGGEWIAVGVLPLPPGTAAELHPLPDASPRPYVLQARGAKRICRL